MKKSFILYTDCFDTIQHLSDEQLGRLTRLLFRYQIDGTTPEVADPLFFPFGFIRATMDRDNQKWEKRAESARVNGAKGGRPKENQDGYEETQKTESVILKPNEPVSVSVNVNASVSDSVIVIPDSHESNRDQIQTLETLETTPPERKKVAPKKEKKTKHLFADSIYAENVDLFISDWNNCSGSISHPEADPIIIYETLKTASNASGYKYISWIDTAINWVKRTPSQFKRTYITQSGKPLHPVEQRMAETLERLNRNSGISNSDGNGYPFTSSQFGDVSFSVPD
jgi:hypothetical protein